MPRSQEVILTNMCLIEDDAGRFVMQLRSPERYAWSGAALPGGHIEEKESLHASVVREIKEETGLTIVNPKLVGVKHFHTRDDGTRYLVFLYRTTEFTGEIQSSEEGEVVWVNRDDIASGRVELADSMDDLLTFYFNDAHSELYYERDADGILQRIFF
ncbi:8-oxo-dGTP diphosphatase [Streptococcus ovuberis]|uniref:8-oxo-dGTP diphosphatase n=1 Tax=Streptococcus ovuberis TaxID=1936207 RepID=A0A7X6MX01_9STRE|nr:8-oxo-dGTP diphosphatase [Streptococcus ovuberis]NKZ19268.1 8-oxo-dGTP diphosphatase [Streptococcus ovuberis]